MIRTQLYIPEDLYARAKALAELRHMNISQFMRESLANNLTAFSTVVRKKGTKGKTQESAYDPLAHMAGKYGKGWPRTDVARHHNNIYEE